jgi:hypothetical protein
MKVNRHETQPLNELEALTKFVSTVALQVEIHINRNIGGHRYYVIICFMTIYFLFLGSCLFTPMFSIH